MHDLNLGELFCGAGGIGLGAMLADYKYGKINHIWATDYDKDSCKTYDKNLNPNKILCADIRKLKFSNLKNLDKINFLTFGFPCNDFSLVGEKKGVNGQFGSLYEYCTAALNYFQPECFLAENVTGLQSSNDGDAFNYILNSFSNAGYTLYPHKYSFEKYGVPQKRQRIVIIGIRADLDIEFNIPSPEEYSKIDISTRTALSNIPHYAKNHEYTKQSAIVEERLKYIKEGENAFNADLPEHLKLNVKGAKISQIYKRLSSAEPAYTITGSGGGGTHTYHYCENRALTNRERARLQSFPDWFVFEGSKESVRKQIGMAVPPLGSKVIIESILKSFSKKQYNYVKPNITFNKDNEIDYRKAI